MSSTPTAMLLSYFSTIFAAHLRVYTRTMGCKRSFNWIRICKHRTRPKWSFDKVDKHSAREPSAWTSKKLSTTMWSTSLTIAFWLTLAPWVSKESLVAREKNGEAWFIYVDRQKTAEEMEPASHRRAFAIINEAGNDHILDKKGRQMGPLKAAPLSPSRKYIRHKLSETASQQCGVCEEKLWAGTLCTCASEERPLIFPFFFQNLWTTVL